ncbi:hypothetical protein GYA28_03925 [Candidatus Roizmanbacteria bacterium]|jgi:hypothetical protein|nr:hypothetical protein [Candidatus Roizmanbacteria bacterium]
MDGNGELISQIKKEEDFISKAKLIKHLIREKGVKIKDLAAFLGMKPSYLCHVLRLNRLPDLVVDGYYSKLITISHLFIVSRLHSEDQMIMAYEQILSRNLSVLQTDYLVREILYGIKSQGKHLNKEEKEKYIREISGKYPGLKIDIVQTRIKGKIIIETKGDVTKTTSTLRLLLGKI